MKSKGEKKNLKIVSNGNKVSISLKSGKFSGGEDSIPVSFKGTISDSGKGCSLKGRYNYGFYLTTLVIASIFLIMLRFFWSVYKGQESNMILCGVVTILLGAVVVVVKLKSKSAKSIINNFITNLNIKQ